MSFGLVNLFVVFGEDAFLVEQALSRLVARISDALGGDVSLESLDCNEAGVETILAEVLTPSLFAQRRIVTLKHLVLGGKSRFNAVIENLLDRDIPEGQFLILVPDRIDRRLKVAKLLEKQAEIYELPRLGHDGLVEWIIDRFRELGKVATRNVAELLLDLKGEDDTRAINSEIEKIVTYVGERERVKATDVEAVAGKTRSEHVFDLISKVALHDVAGALETLAGLFMTGESPIGIVYLLAREIKALLQVHLFLRDRGLKIGSNLDYSGFVRTLLPEFRNWVEESKIPHRDSLIRQKPYAIYRRFVEAAGFDLGELVDLLDALVEINLELVTTTIDPRILIENFVISVGGCQEQV